MAERLVIVSSMAEEPWLRYILDQFKAIQKAEFDIELSSKEPEDTTTPALHYGGTSFSSPAIPSAQSSRVFSLQDVKSILTDDSGIIAHDLLRQAFVLLSRIEEYDAALKGKNLLSYSARHPSSGTEQFDRPYVNLLFAHLESFLIKHYPSLPFGAKEKAVISYNHDLDYIRKTIQLRLKQTAFNKYNTLKSIGNGSLFFSNLKKTFSFFFSNPSYWCFDYWDELEKKYDQRSTYYIYAKAGGKNLKTWLIDPSYDVSSNQKLQDQLRSLSSDGHQIGLHGSFNSAIDADVLGREKETLEKALGMEVNKTRQHWLRFEEAVTPQIHAELFEEDATLGWNDKMGYRAGVASQYQPYDHEAERPFNYMETPTIIMDSNIYDYGAKDVKSQSHKALGMIEEISKLKSAHVAISWHPRVCSSDYNWHPVYEQLIKAAH